MRMSDQEEPDRTCEGLSFKSWFQIVAAFVIIGFLAPVVVSILPVIQAWSSTIGFVVVWTLIVCIPGSLAVAAFHVWSNYKLKHFQAHVIKPNANNAYGAVYVEADKQFVQAVPIAPPNVVPQHYSPSIHQHNDVGQILKMLELRNNGAQGILEEPVDYVPEPYTMSSMLHSGWEPTKSGILLAKKDQPVLVPIGEPLCHTTFTGNTSAGKTNNERVLIIQLLYLEQRVFLCDRNYQRFRLDNGTGTVYDYSPIESLLAAPPIYNARQCLALLKDRYSELEDRRIRRHKAVVRFRDEYIVMDELPAFSGDEPEIMSLLGKFLRESRQYGIFVICAAQDLLNKTLNNDNGAVRDNLLTNYYGGGDATTARLVLNLKRGDTIDEAGLGTKGMVYLRAKGVGIERIKCRTPLADNTATMTLLRDMATGQPLMDIPVIESDPVLSQSEEDEPSIIPLRPKQQEKREATLYDAVQVWNNEQDLTMGSPRLRELLLAQGLACSDYRSRQLLANIKARLKEEQA